MKSYNTLNRESKELLGLKRIGMIFGSTLQIDKLLKLVVEEICALLDADRGSLFLVDEEQQILWSKIALKSEITEIKLPIGKGIAGYVAETGDVVNIKDAYKDSRFNPEVDKKTGYKTKSIVCVPLRKPVLEEDHNRNTVIGVLQLLNKNSEDGFSDEDIDLLLSLGGSLASLLHNANLYHQLKEQYAQLELLYEGEKIISAKNELEVIFDNLLELFLKKLSLPAGLILLRDQQGFKGYWKLNEKESGIIVQNILVLNERYPFEIERPTLLEVTDDNANLFSFYRELNIHPKRVLCLPIRTENQYYGVINFILGNETVSLDDYIWKFISSQISRAYELYLTRKNMIEQERMSMIGTMMSAVVHDLRSPLNNIMGYVDLVFDDDTTAEERTEYKQIIDSEIQNMVKMSNEILDFAKGRRTTFLRKVGLFELMDEFEKRIAISMEKNSIQLEKGEIPKGRIRADKEKLLRAFVNIARNAIEALLEKESDRIFKYWIEEEEDDYIIHFRDNGPGIPEEIQDKLFQKFATAGKAHGTGLGLMNVKNIIEEHNGNIDFYTEKDVGTEFIITIPMLKK